MQDAEAGFPAACLLRPASCLLPPRLNHPTLTSNGTALGWGTLGIGDGTPMGKPSFVGRPGELRIKDRRG